MRKNKNQNKMSKSLSSNVSVETILMTDAK